MSANNTLGSTGLFMLGVGAGAIAALLLAPKTGEDLRNDIAERASEGGRQLSAQGREMKQRIQKAAGQLQDQAHKAASQAQKAVSQAQDNVQEAISAGQNAYDYAKNIS